MTRDRVTLILFLALFVSVVAGADPAKNEGFPETAVLRGHLRNSRLLFEREKKGHVAFMGGSITEMEGYRPLVCSDLQRRFADTEFTFTDAGIASTCSTTGAFRLRTDVLQKGPVDLFFVEFAVNDDQDAKHTRQECIRGLEGIVRQLRRHNPYADIVIVYFVNPEMLATLQRGDTPLTIASHETVAKRYEVSSVNLAREVAEEITEGKLTWKKYGGTHPARAGNVLCSRMVAALLDRAWKGAAAKERAPHALPRPLDSFHYGHGKFVDSSRSTIVRGWRLGIPDWSRLPGSKRGRFSVIEMLSATEPGAELTLDFRGTLVGAYIVAGPDAGILDGTVDGEAFAPVDLYHRFSAGLHYPRTVLFADKLKPGEHRLVLRVADSTRSKGHAARIIQFVVNETPGSP